ncbi:MAG: hypothetical protein MUF31_13830 [Akkermansiaceae bacterium]|jgi:anti-sigma factor RsiW|nr:hypothetical protein [Akkermansiaceae bacterium]
MNTKPDDEMLALWLEDELDPARTAAVDAWAANEPEWLEHRAAARALKPMLACAAIPREEEVPHAEFFNARIRREIELAAALPAAAAPVVPGRVQRRFWLVPATAAAGIALGFWVGRGVPSGPEPLPPPVADLAPVLYTPEKGVAAEFVATENATVIVLDGVAALPDEWSIPETAVQEPEARPVADRR